MLLFCSHIPLSPNYPPIHFSLSHSRSQLSHLLSSAKPTPSVALQPLSSSTTISTPGLPPSLSFNFHSSSPSHQPLPTPHRDIYQPLLKLIQAKGALGRGVRATLRAFHRRAATLNSHPIYSHLPVYIEIGPAYVIASSASQHKPVTRYAVEQRAWPKLRQLCQWSEHSAASARNAGATLRPLRPGLRFGRHIFITTSALDQILAVAKTLLPPPSLPHAIHQNNTHTNPTHPPINHLIHIPPQHQPPLSRLEAVLPLPRIPMPGVRTVAARCPRRASHAHRDANPSLILWMNSDGRSGGALCPVCTHQNNHLTWRVSYLSTATAALYTPHSRPTLPRRVQIAALHALKAATAPSSPNQFSSPNRSTPQSAHSSIPHDAAITKKLTSEIVPVGGCIMPTRKRPHVGHVFSMAYVTASLRTNHTSVSTPDGEHIRLRTVGTKARQSCPIQLLVWSDRRSKGPLIAQRVQEVSWYAKQILVEKSMALDKEQWLPTPLVSVSAMKPSAWRDVNTSRGRCISVPASWEPTAQSWILFDIDDLQNLSDTVEEVAQKLVRVARRDPELSGQCLVVHTGPEGVHLWVQLREVRETPKLWFRTEEVRAWYSQLGSRLLGACHRAGAKNGKVDMSSCAAGRFARRPGWRLLEDGSLFRSSIVMHVPGPVKNRKPRTS